MALELFKRNHFSTAGLNLDGRSHRTLAANEALRPVKVDFEALEMAFEDEGLEHANFLDLETGEVIMVTDETKLMLEEICEEAVEDDSEPEAVLDAIEASDAHEWQKDALRDAEAVERGLGTRYLRVPDNDSDEGFRDMEAFAETVTDKNFADRLWSSLGGKGSFRRFKDTLHDDGDELRRWYEFKQARLRERISDWLETEGFRPVPLSDSL